MVQGEKNSAAMTMGSSSSRTSNADARKAGYDAVKRMEQAKMSTSGSSSGKNGQSEQNQYGSWGPMFKNKSNFAEMHFC